MPKSSRRPRRSNSGDQRFARAALQPWRETPLMPLACLQPWPTPQGGSRPMNSSPNDAFQSQIVSSSILFSTWPDKHFAVQSSPATDWLRCAIIPVVQVRSVGTQKRTCAGCSPSVQYGWKAVDPLERIDQDTWAYSPATITRDLRSTLCFQPRSRGRCRRAGRPLVSVLQNQY